MANEQLKKCWLAAIEAVNGRSAVKSSLENYHEHQETPFDYLISVGKAASQMALGAYDAMPNICKGLVVTKRKHVDDALRSKPGLHIIEAGHPIPDQQSLDAGAALISFINSIPPNGKILLLVSGGASSLVEVLPDGISLLELQNLNEYFMSTGLSIEQINAARKSFSMIKGGKLVPYLEGRETLALFISDVPGDQVDIIGSGLLFQTNEQASMNGHIDNNVSTKIIANNEMACEAAMSEAQQSGLCVSYDENLYQQDISIVADHICHQLRQADGGVYIWGGESTVVLPESPGKGGRNQSLALLLAQKISGWEGVNLLVAGTDGTDGPTDAAGAWIDGATIEAGVSLELDAKDYYQNADAYTYFDQINALFKSGPTGTNVMDIVIGIIK